MYRAFQMMKNIIYKGTPIDYRNSNWFDKETHRFKRSNLIPLAGNFIPNLLGLISIALAFKYAAKGGLNQGILPTLTSLSGVYSAIIFYFSFNELVSPAQIFGMILMLVCVVFLGLEGAEASKHIRIDQTGANILEQRQHQEQSLWYAIYAIFWGLMCPIFYTIKAWCIRKYATEYEYWDLGVDAVIFEQLCYCLMYGVYIYDQGFNLNEFLYG